MPSQKPEPPRKGNRRILPKPRCSLHGSIRRRHDSINLENSAALQGRIFAGLVGQSESNLQAVIQTAEAIAPCCLWIDEVEKGFSGTKSSNATDGGTSSRVFGSFLSWMQDKNAQVFVVATANDVTQLPPEMLRKGRFDEIMFVDLPNQAEREAIWEIQIGKHGRAPADFDLVQLAKATEGLAE